METRLRHIARLLLPPKRTQSGSEGAGGFKGPGIELGSPWHDAPMLIRRSLVIRLPSATSLDLVFSALLRLLQDLFGPKSSKKTSSTKGERFQPPGICDIR